MKTVRYGGFWRRAIAIWMDGLVIQLIIFLAFVTMKYILPSSMATDTAGYSAFSAGYIYLSGGLFMNMSYYTLFHGMGGQTPGKWLMGVKVIRDTGEEMTLGHAFLRWVGYLVSYLFLFIGFIWVAFDRRKQGWHDKIAGTIVVRTRGLCARGSREESSPSESSIKHLPIYSP